ncbi:MAG: hypothetical protein IIB77_11035 [Proteobacteria bacterium]|nr:hypothetical protein [Pseudomonadota bacterium]
MAKTLLNGVNELLKKVNIIDEDAGIFTTLSDSANQTFIDLAVQSINETVDELYSVSRRPKPKQLAESTITLVADDQDYALETDLIRIHRDFGLIDETNTRFITILDEDGYRQLIIADMGQDDTGLPHLAAIRPTDGELFLDRKPTSAEVGLIYKYRYDKDLVLSAADDAFPFTDTVFRALISAAAELWRFHKHGEFAQGLFNASLARAARYLSKINERTSWQPGRNAGNITDPMERAR